jgi:hypothetical protein
MRRTEIKSINIKDYFEFIPTIFQNKLASSEQVRVLNKKERQMYEEKFIESSS